MLQLFTLFCDLHNRQHGFPNSIHLIGKYLIINKIEWD